MRSFLKEKLPDYIIPQFFIALKELPLSPNGKIDRKALPKPTEALQSTQKLDNPPHTPSEIIIAGIWSELLKIQKFDVNDNFFELGGHSLLATQVVSRIRQVFKVEIPLNFNF